MALQDPWGFDTKIYSGQEMRLHTAAVTGGRGGVSTITDLVATPQGSPNNTVTVSAGQGIIPATHAGDLGSYEVPNDAALTSPTFAAAGGSGRRDLLILQVTAGVAALKVVAGTPSGSPVYPSLAAEENYIVICGVLMPAGKSIIDNGGVNGSIEDRRSLWAPYVVCTSTTRPPIPFDGQMIEEQDTERVYIWDAANSQWAPSRLYIGTAASLPAAPKQGTPAYVSDANLPTGTMVPDATSVPPAPGLYVFDQRWDPPWNLPWGVLGYKQIVANQTPIVALADLTGLSLAVTYRANRRIRVTGSALFSSSIANDQISGYITDAANNIKQRFFQDEVLVANQAIAGERSFTFVSTSGAATFKLRGERTSGTGNVTLFADPLFPSFILIEDLGPAGQPA